MRRIQSSNTKPEKMVRSLLHRMGFRFRINQINLPGKPDIVLKKHSTIIFVHGCFWHGHRNCKRSNTPKTNRDYWINKIQTNVKRDKKNIRELKKQGWKVIVVWECNANKTVKLNKLFSTTKLLNALMFPPFFINKSGKSKIKIPPVLLYT